MCFRDHGLDACVVGGDYSVQPSASNRNEGNVPQGIVVCPFLRISLAPVVIDIVIYLDNLAVEGDRRARMRGGHGYYRVDGICLVVGHCEHGAGHDAAHGMTKDQN